MLLYNGTGKRDAAPENVYSGWHLWRKQPSTKLLWTVRPLSCFTSRPSLTFDRFHLQQCSEWLERSVIQLLVDRNSWTIRSYPIFGSAMSDSTFFSLFLLFTPSKLKDVINLVNDIDIIQQTKEHIPTAGSMGYHIVYLLGVLCVGYIPVDLQTSAKIRTFFVFEQITRSSW